MSTTTHKGAEGAETMTAPFGEPVYDPASEIATKVMALPWSSSGLTDPHSGVFDHDEMGERHGAIQTIADKVIRAALASPRADSAERTAGAILTEACKPWEHCTGEPPDDGSPLSGVFVAGMVYTERLLAKLLDVTHYEGGDGSEDFDNDATQTLRNILIGASLWDADENRLATPAPATPPGVPDGLRALSEAADYAAERWTEIVDTDGLSDRERYRIKSQAKSARRAFENACADFVRTLLSTHPDGQSAGSGAGSALTCTEAECDESYKIGQRDGYDEGVQDAAIRAGLDGEYRASSDPDRHVPDATTMLERIAERVDGLEASLERANKPAPDSTRTGDEGTEEARLIGPKMTPEQEERIAHNLCGEFGPDAVVASAAFVRAFYAELYAAARPAAPEAQGAWLPISTAPKDGTEFAAYENGDVYKCHWKGYDDGEGRWSEGWFDHVNESLENPTHWCSLDRLPAPPASSGQGGR